MAYINNLLVVVVGLSFVNCDGTKSLLNDAKSEGRLLRFDESVHKLVESIKTVKIKTTAEEVRLIHILNEMLYKSEIGIFEFNQGIPTIQNKIIRDTLEEAINLFAVLTEEVQSQLHGPTKKLIENYAQVLEKSFAGLRKLSAVFQRADYKNELFAINQVRRWFNEVTYGVVKLTLELDLFYKTNKDLEGEIDSALEGFCKSLQNVKNDDAKAKDELVHLIQQLERVQNLVYSKLQNYVRINEADEKSTGIVKEVIKKLSVSFDSFSQLTSINRDVAQLKTDFEKLYRAATGFVKKLLQVEVAENAPGALYIRSTLFDAIALSKIGERELNAINTKDTARNLNLNI